MRRRLGVLQLSAKIDSQPASVEYMTDWVVVKLANRNIQGARKS